MRVETSRRARVLKDRAEAGLKDTSGDLQELSDRNIALHGHLVKKAEREGIEPSQLAQSKKAHAEKQQETAQKVRERYHTPR